MNGRQEKLRQYLLGNLPSEEAAKLDLQIIENADLEEELILAEHDLMEDCLENTLSEAEKNLFHSNFLKSEERIQSLEHLALLKQYAQQAAQHSMRQIVEEETLLSKLKNLLGLRPVLVPSAAVILLLSIGLFWLIFQSNGNSPFQADFVKINRTNLGNLSEFQDISHLSLIEGTLRDTQEAKKLPAGKMGERVLIRLALPVTFKTESEFDVKISKNIGETLYLEKVRSYQNQGGTEIRLLVPSAFLTKGTYKIEVWAEGKSDSPMNYTFLVE